MSEISRAVEILRAGGIVAFPTETVYGLGADARNASAVRKVFAAKGRPATNPLIVHVADAESAARYGVWDDRAAKLAGRFWPGPLTLVVRRRAEIVPEVSAGLETVALRAPDHRLAMELLRRFDGPIAAPSANRSTHISPTTAEHVRASLGASVDLILDGGPCRVGIESTVLDLSGDVPTILRPGGIGRSALAEILGRVEVRASQSDLSQAEKSPGMSSLHYAPRTPCLRVELEEVSSAIEWLGADINSIVLTPTPARWPAVLRKIAMPPDAETYASALYAALHEADASGAARIVVEMPPTEESWAAVRDRLMRASQDWRRS
jgi:L-threonylcarbamoyladenylate synthase